MPRLPQETLSTVLITVSATLDENLGSQMPLCSDAEVLWSHTTASGVTDAMIEALSTLIIGSCGASTRGG